MRRWIGIKVCNPSFGAENISVAQSELIWPFILTLRRGFVVTDTNSLLLLRLEIVNLVFWINTGWLIACTVLLGT